MGNVEGVPVEVNVTLSLPRDAFTVPVVRHLCNSTMYELGVDASCRSDILIALTEACTNVIDHAADGRDYRVDLKLDEGRCTIAVMDEGSGFDASARGQARRDVVDLDAEAGRGIDLMRALVDRVSFVSEPQDGTIVCLHKDLDFVDGHPLRERLIGRRQS